jgi:hypothetical protein
MNSSKGAARLAGHADNVTEPADALLALELTPDAGQSLTRPAGIRSSERPAGTAGGNGFTPAPPDGNQPAQGRPSQVE